MTEKMDKHMTVGELQARLNELLEEGVNFEGTPITKDSPISIGVEYDEGPGGLYYRRMDVPIKWVGTCEAGCKHVHIMSEKVKRDK